MIQQSNVQFLVHQIKFQSNHFYQSKIDQILQFTHPSDRPLLQNLLQEISQHQYEMNQIQHLHFYLMHTRRKEFDTLLDLLINKYLDNYLSNINRTVFVIFMTVIYQRKDDTQQIAQKVYVKFETQKVGCCVVYLHLLKWLREVFQAKKMAAFIKYVIRDLQKVQEPLLKLYKSQLYLNLRFYKRQSGEDMGIKFDQGIDQNMNIQLYLYEQFRTQYLKRNLQKMVQLRQKIFQLRHVTLEQKAYCRAAIASTLSLRGQTYEAIAQYQQALTYGFFSASIIYEISCCYFVLKQWTKVCKTIQYFENNNLLINNKYQGNVWAIKGRAIYQLNKLTDQDDTFDIDHFNTAYEYCCKARKCEENNFIANETLSLISLEFNNTQAAINLLQPFLDSCTQKQKNQVKILLSYCYYISQNKFMQIPILSMNEQTLLCDRFQYQFMAQLIKFYRPQIYASFQLNFNYFQERQAQMFINLGIQARKSSNIDFAMKYLAMALKLSKQNVQAKLQIAECLKLKNKELSSLYYFKQAIELIQNTKQSQVKLSRQRLIISILQVYVKIFTENNQLQLIEMKSTLVEAEKFLKEFQSLTNKNQVLSKKQKSIIQKLKKILSQDKTELYFNLVRLYFKNRLSEFALEIISQAKRDLFGFIDTASEVQADIKASYHTSKVFIELKRFQEAQKYLIDFWTAIYDHQLQEPFTKQWAESYQFLFSILKQKNRKKEFWDFSTFEPFIRPSVNEKVMFQVAEILLQNNQHTAALKYFIQVRRLNIEKRTLQKIIQIYQARPDLIEQHQILPELLSQYQQMVQSSLDYKFLITAAKLLKNFDRVQKYWQQFFSIQKKSQLLIQISKDLGDFYQQNGKILQSCKLYAYYFTVQPSNQVMQKVQKMLQNGQSVQLNQKQYSKFVIGLITQVTGFQKFLINCRYNQFNECLNFVNKWIKQLRIVSTVQLRQEIEQKTSLIKRASTKNCFCALIIQIILYDFLFRAMLSNKTIQNTIRISLRPKFFKALGASKQYFGKQQLQIIFEKINQQLSKENMILIFQFVISQNKIMRKSNENTEILQYARQRFGAMIQQKLPL